MVPNFSAQIRHAGNIGFLMEMRDHFWKHRQIYDQKIRNPSAVRVGVRLLHPIFVRSIEYFMQYYI